MALPQWNFQPAEKVVIAGNAAAGPILPSLVGTAK